MANCRIEYREASSLKLHRILILDQSGLLSFDETNIIVRKLESTLLLGPTRIESFTLGIYRPSNEFHLILQQTQLRLGAYNVIKNALHGADLSRCSKSRPKRNKWFDIFSQLYTVMIETDLYHLTIISEDDYSLMFFEFSKIWKSEQFTGITVLRTPGCGRNVGKKNNFECEIWDEVIIQRYEEIDNIFKAWLLDPSPVQDEHVRIRLPSSIFNKDGDLVILCDVYTRHINPLKFPAQISSSLILQAESTTFSMGSIPRVNKIPIYNIKITCRIPIQGICQSLVYDISGATLKPTSSFKLDGIVQNIERFKCLAKMARNKSEVFMAESESNGIFVLIPGPEDETFLIKSLVTKDLLLPIPLIASSMDGSVDTGEVEIEVEASFDKIKQIEYYDPYEKNTNLMESLECHLLKKK
ncbi:uncharacterized protein [Lepeophtheirus salmonis]|uniref:uncharacterized protein isoform X2 n=1 Tax=Lepeophtheirus salmonis TaxID=72036 RepID=UPI001AE16902|nr:uncharacterized protein LOC121122468 isoform X2 [Lepeophtheirus salmonis]